jgi:hypothetical protein
MGRTAARRNEDGRALEGLALTAKNEMLRSIRPTRGSLERATLVRTNDVLEPTRP